MDPIINIPATSEDSKSAEGPALQTPFSPNMDGRIITNGIKNKT